LDELTEQDYLSVVTFDSFTEVVLEPTEYGDLSRDRVEDKIDELMALGGTDLYNGVESAADELWSASEEGMVDRIILLTDGHGDRASETEAYERLGEEVDEMGISIVTGGIGNYHEEAMVALADASGGTTQDIDSPEDIHGFLSTAFGEASKVLVNKPQLRIDPGAGFIIPASHPKYDDKKRIYRIVDKSEDEFERQIPSFDTDGDTVVVDLADLAAQRSQSIVLEFLGQRKSPGLSYTLADVTLTSGGRTLAEKEVEVEYTEELSKQQINEDIEKERFLSKVVADLNDESVNDGAVKKLIDAKERDRDSWDRTITKARAKLDSGKVERRVGEKREIEDPTK